MDMLEFSTNNTDPQLKVDTTTGNISFFPLQKHVGDLYIKLKVSDWENSSEQDIWFEVANENDGPEFSGIDAVISNLTVNCSLIDLFDEDNDPLIFKWEFGDGTDITTSDPYIEHTYTTSGNYNISVMVTDGHGGIASGKIMVGVSQGSDQDNDTDNGDGNGDDNGGDSITDDDDDSMDDDWELDYFGNLSQDKDDDFDDDG